MSFSSRSYRLAARFTRIVMERSMHLSCAISPPLHREECTHLNDHLALQARVASLEKEAGDGKKSGFQVDVPGVCITYVSLRKALRSYRISRLVSDLRGGSKRRLGLEIYPINSGEGVVWVAVWVALAQPVGWGEWGRGSHALMQCTCPKAKATAGYGGVI